MLMGKSKEFSLETFIRILGRGIQYNNILGRQNTNQYLYRYSVTFIPGSRSTFEFPSRVNLSGPSLYCIVQTLGK